MISGEALLSVQVRLSRNVSLSEMNKTETKAHPLAILLEPPFIPDWACQHL